MSVEGEIKAALNWWVVVCLASAVQSVPSTVAVQVCNKQDPPQFVGSRPHKDKPQRGPAMLHFSPKVLSLRSFVSIPSASL